MTAVQEQDYKSIGVLARLLAMENITVQHVPGRSTASFDVRSRVLYLPVWVGVSRDLIDMLVIHEVGHALDTPHSGWIEGVSAIAEKHHKVVTPIHQEAIRGFTNVIEDVRIDKRQKRRFPGSVKNYVKGYKELLDRNFFGIEGKDINKLAFIDRVNIYCKAGALLGINFTDEEKAFLKRIQESETFEEVLQLTDEVYGWSMKHDPAFQNHKNLILDETLEGPFRGLLKIQSPDGTELVEKEDFDPGEAARDEEEKKLNSDEDEEEDEDEDDEVEGGITEIPGDHAPRKLADKEEDEEEDEDQEADADESDAEEDDDNEDNEEEEEEIVPQSLTDEAWNKASVKMTADIKDQYMYLDMPIPNHRRIVDDYKVVMKQWSESINSRVNEGWGTVSSNSFNEWRKKEAATISFLVKEFEMRKAADIYARTATAKTGMIDTNKLHSYKFSDDIFRRLQLEPKGTNHGFFMILDWSMSMTDLIDSTIKQLLSLVLFCKRTNMPFEVYLFRDPTMTEMHDDYWTIPERSINFANYKLRNILSSRMSQNELNAAMLNLWNHRTQRSDPMGYTPLNETIITIPSMINDFQKKNKLQVVNTIILTDGDSNGNQYTQPIIEEAKKVEKGGKNHYILRDKVTKKDIYVENHFQTRHYLEILKARTNSNVIGFYLTSYGWSEVSRRYMKAADWGKVAAFEKLWKEEKFIATTREGFDEYYILSVNDLRTDRNVLDVNDSMTRKSVEKKFKAYIAGKTINRALLRKFAERISNEKKSA